MIYLWIMSERSGKGYYFPEQKNWSDRIDISIGVLNRTEPAWMNVLAEESRWYAIPPEGFQWEDGTGERQELISGSILKMRDGEYSVNIVISEEKRENTLLYKFVWPGSRVTIGKSEQNDISCRDVLVSHQHGEILREEKEISYRDRSRNGSWINGRLISNQTVKLEPGDHLFIPPFFHIMVFHEFLAVNQTERISFSETLKDYVPPRNESVRNLTDGSVWKEYHRAPRQIQKPDSEPIVIDPPLEKQREKKIPGWLTLGPSLTMMVPMLVSSVVMGRNMAASLVMMGTSAGLSTMWAVLNRRYAEKDLKVTEENRQKLCKQYYLETEEKLAACTEHELKRLNLNYLSVEECVELPDSKGHRMWEKQPVHPDFLCVRLGVGEAKLPNEISVQKQKIDMVDDPLRREPQRLKDQYRMMKDAPIVLDVKQHRIIGVLGNKQSPWLLQSMVVQVAAEHSYHDVRIIILHDESDAAQWKFTYHLPHVFASDDRTLRMAVGGENATHEVLTVLDNTLSIRQESQRENSDGTEKENDISGQIPWYVVFVTDPKIIENEPVMRYMSTPGLGFTLVMLADQTEKLPKECDLIVEAYSSIGTVFQSDGTMTGVKFEMADQIQMKRFANAMAPYRIREMSGSSSIPTLVTFLETYHVNKIEDLDICRNWNENHAWKNINSTLGFKSGGVPFVLDISDKNHGPHGLIAGTTGAGKSVLLQSFILSLALNYSPSEVQFILIDYKGGGTSEDFRDLPHAAGVIDSLQGERTIFRALASIQGEIKRREAIFKEAGVNNIDDYMKLFNADPNEPTLGHVIIIVDEFAELKKEQPDFMRELVSAARVGRSLGMHLVLATQKPGNSVSEEIDANTRFRICLRVASRSDSTEMLKRPEAAYLKGMGRCYVQVGNNEVFEQVQTSWSGAVYKPDALRPEEEPRMLNELGQPVAFPKKKMHSKENAAVKEKREIDVVLEYITNSCQKYHFEPAHKMWLQEIGQTLMLNDILNTFGMPVWNGEKWPDQPDDRLLCLFGMGDDVDTQQRIPAQIDFIADHNVMMTGLSGSGKTTFMQTVAVSLALTYSPEKLQMYIFSLTTHVLQSLAELPQVGDIVFEDDRDEQGRMIDLLYQESLRRKTLFREMATDNFTQYNRSVPDNPDAEELPAVVVLLDGMSKIREWESMHMEDKLSKFYEMLHTGSGQGIFFVIGGLGKNELPVSQQKFVKGFTLKQNERSDYADALGARIPSEWGGIREYPGRGLLAIENKEKKATYVYEMQTAVYGTAQSDKARSNAVVGLGRQMSAAWKGKLPRKIARIPEKPLLEHLLSNQDIDRYMKNPVQLPMGYIKSTGELFSVDLHTCYAGMVAGPRKSGKSTWVRVTALTMQKKGARVVVIGPEEMASWARKNGLEAYAYGQQDWEPCFNEIVKNVLGERTAMLKQAKAAGVREYKRVSDSFRMVMLLIDDLDKYVAAFPNTVKMLTNFVADNEKIATYKVATFATVSRKAYQENQSQEPFRALRTSKRGLLLQGVNNEFDPFGISYKLPRGITYPAGEAIMMYDDEMRHVVLPQDRLKEEGSQDEM